MIKEAELAKELKNGVPGGIYFFYGDEDFMKNRRAADMKRDSVGADPSLSAFNCFEFVFGDGEFDAAAVEDALLAPPMMSPKKFISLTFSSVDSLKARGREADPDSDGSSPDVGGQDADPGGKKGGKSRTVIVIKAVSGGFDPGTAKAPSSFLREADRFMRCVEFPYQPDGKLTRWMERHFAEYGLCADPEVCKWILKTAGKSMYRLTGELAKTAAYTAVRAERDHAAPVVTPSTA